MIDEMNEAGTEESVKTLPGRFPLDWKTQEIRLGKGRFTHTVRRPTIDEIFARDAELEAEIEIGRAGEYSIPDPTINDRVDAKFYDLIALGNTGYPDAVPTTHKAAVFNALYRREVELAEDATALDAEIAITEEIGTGPEPEFTVTHTLRQPSEEQIRRYRQRAAAGIITPGKRGRQIFKGRSILKPAVAFYDELVESITGATVGGQEYSADTRAEFLTAVDPLIKQAVVKKLFEAVNQSLLD